MFFTKYLPFYKRNIRLAFPIILTQLGGGIVAVVDNIMVGQLGSTELAAVAFANSIFFIGYVFAQGSVMSITPLVGQAFVKKEEKTLSTLLQNGIAYTFLLGFLVCFVLWICYLFMHRMGQDTEVVALAKPFFLLLLASLIPLLFFNLFKQYLEGFGNTKIAMYITLVANLLNVGLNYLWIFGKMGFPALGVVGAGLATLVSRVVMLLLFMLVFLWVPQWRVYWKGFKRKHFNRQQQTEIARIGLPIGGHMLLEVSAFALSAIMVGWIGVIELAANQIVQNISHLAFMVVVGVASATTIRVSHQYGVKDFSALRMAVKASVHLALFCSTGMALAIVIGRYAIASIYTNEIEVIDMAASLLLLCALYQLSDGLQVVAAGVLRGLTDVRITMLYAFIAYICINLPVGYLLAFVFGLGAHGIWIGFVLGLSISAILLLLRYKKQIAKLERAEKGER